MQRPLISLIPLFGLVLLLSGCVTEVDEAEEMPEPPPEGHLFGDYEERSGEEDARTDIRAGSPKLKVYGLPSAASGTYAELLQEATGIAYQPIAGCVVSQSLVDYANAYNQTITEYAEDKFGEGIFERLWAEAEREYQAEMGEVAVPTE